MIEQCGFAPVAPDHHFLLFQRVNSPSRASRPLF
jgi:hypothetical protein